MISNSKADWIQRSSNFLNSQLQEFFPGLQEYLHCLLLQFYHHSLELNFQLANRILQMFVPNGEKKRSLVTIIYFLCCLFYSALFGDQKCAYFRVKQRPLRFNVLFEFWIDPKSPYINCQKRTCELMTNCLRSFSSLSAGFLNVDLGVGTGFRFVAGDPRPLATSEVTFGDSPFMSKLLQMRSV